LLDQEGEQADQKRVRCLGALKLLDIQIYNNRLKKMLTYDVIQDINIASCIIGCISLVASIITIRLILIHPKRKSGYLLLILSLATTQLSVDISHIIIPSSGIKYSKQVCELKGFLLIFGLLSTAFWTNLIAFQVFYVVFIGKSFEIRKYYIILFTICIGLPALFAIVTIGKGFIYNSKSVTSSCFLVPPDSITINSIYDDTSSDDEIILRQRYDITNAYDIFHFMSLSFNFVTSAGVLINVLFYNTVKSLNLLNEQTRLSIFSLSSITSMISGNRSRRQEAIKTLALRLILYPIVQNAAEIFRIADEATSSKYLSLVIINEMISSLLGTFYFLIFLSMQPNARILLINDIKNSCCKNKKDDNGLSTPLNSIETLRVTWIDDNQRVTNTQIADMDEDQLLLEIEIDDENDNILSRNISNNNSTATISIVNNNDNIRSSLTLENELTRR